MENNAVDQIRSLKRDYLKYQYSRDDMTVDALVVACVAATKWHTRTRLVASDIDSEDQICRKFMMVEKEMKPFLTKLVNLRGVTDALQHLLYDAQDLSNDPTIDQSDREVLGSRTHALMSARAAISRRIAIFDPPRTRAWDSDWPATSSG